MPLAPDTTHPWYHSPPTLLAPQLFYDTDQLLKFVTDCRKEGITAPIIPGIMPIMTYNGFKRMTGFCKTKVSAIPSEAVSGPSPSCMIDRPR